MSRFWDLMEKSTLVSGLIALVMVIAACYCVVQGIVLPDYFQMMLGVIVGYFFSEKVRGARDSHTSYLTPILDEEGAKRLTAEMRKARNVQQAAKREQDHTRYPHGRRD